MFGGGKTMNFSQIIRTLFEIGLAVLVIWSVFHEDIFIAIEERIVSYFKRKRLKVVSGSTYKSYK